MHIAIVNFTGFRGNWGCQATSFELLKFLAGSVREAEPLSISYVPLLPTSTVDAEYNSEIDRVYRAFSDVARQTDAAASSLVYLETACLRRYGFWADAVKAADLVVFQAEGSMGLGTSFAHAPRLMLLPFVAKHAWGKTAISLNQTFYSQDENVLQNAAECFSTLDLAAFREPCSVALARKNGVKNAVLIPDLAFMTPAGTAAPLPRNIESGGFFAITGSALKDPDRYRRILAQARTISAATGLRPLIAVSRDLPLRLRAVLTMRPGSYAIVPRDITYSRVASFLQHCEFLLGGRYHMSIVAAAAGTPSIMLRGNSIKNEGLAALLGSARPVRDFADEAGIVADAIAITGNRAAERATLQSRLALIRGRILAAQQHVAQIVAGEKPPQFLDGELSEVPFDPTLLEQYRRFGSGKRAKGLPPLPGARLGGPPTPEQVALPLLEGLSNDKARTLATLSPLIKSEPGFARVVRARLDIYPDAATLFS
jgi:hypothetical protein